MTVREKRPPVRVEELGKDPKTRRDPPESGSLGYLMGAKKEKELSEKVPAEAAQIEEVTRVGFGRFGVTLKRSTLRLLLPIIVSVALAAVLLTWFAPTKSQFGTLLGEVEGLRESAAWIAGRVDEKVAELQEMIADEGFIRILSEEQLGSYILALSERIKVLEGR